MTEEYLGGLDNRQNSKSETEVVVRAKRRQHTAEYKPQILRELDECTGKGEVGAILLREGLYSSLIGRWREQREQGSADHLNRLQLPHCGVMNSESSFSNREKSFAAKTILLFSARSVCFKLALAGSNVW